MNFEAVYKRSVNLLLNPKLEWGIIKSENKSKKEVLNTYAMPVAIVVALCSMIGNFIYASRFVFSLPYVIFNGIAIFIIGYLGTYFSALLINEITPSFNTKKEINNTFNLVVYSLAAFSIFWAIALLLPSPFYQIRFFGFYSLYLFWLGSETLAETPADNKVGFVFVSNLILFGVFSILSTIFSIILKGVFNLSLVLK